MHILNKHSGRDVACKRLRRELAANSPVLNRRGSVCIRGEEVRRSGGLLSSAFDDGVRRGFAAFTSGFEPGRRIDQRAMAETLRKVAHLLAAIRLNFLREQPDIVLE